MNAPSALNVPERASKRRPRSIAIVAVAAGVLLAPLLAAPAHAVGGANADLCVASTSLADRHGTIRVGCSDGGVALGDRQVRGTAMFYRSGNTHLSSGYRVYTEWTCGAETSFTTWRPNIRKVGEAELEYRDVAPGTC